MIFSDPNGGFIFNQKIIDKSPNLIRQGLYQVCKNTQKSAKSETRKKNKTGRVYMINKNGKVVKHQSSAPNESHANITGTLTKSIDFSVEHSTMALFGYDNSTNYGKYVELGTSRMQQRPTLKNAMKTEKTRNNNIMANTIKPENIK